MNGNGHPERAAAMIMAAFEGYSADFSERATKEIITRLAVK